MNRTLNLNCSTLPNRAPLHLVRRACLPLLLATLLCPFTLPAQAQRSTKYGAGALFSNSSDDNNNTAFGAIALYYSTTGIWDTAIGNAALRFNTTGTSNTASGGLALYSNTTGNQNTADGFCALFYNTSGNLNTASGAFSLYYNTTGTDNTVSGEAALSNNTTGNNNTVSGSNALSNNTTGNNNTASGFNALLSSITGNGNIALGYQAGYNITAGSNNIAIGSQGASGDNGVIRIGTVGTQTAAFIAGINGVASPKGIQVFVNSQGQLGTFTSSRRYKKDIHELGDLSRKVMALRPVSFRYKQAAEDGTHPLQYGLIAEEVAKIAPELVAYDRTGKPYSVNYHLLTPLLLSELQKAHHQIEQEHHRNIEQKSELAALKAAHSSKIASLEAALQQQHTELAAMKQAQQQQLQALAKLTASLQASGKTSAQHQAVLLAH